jgi:ceramide glucosyltransferase
MTVCNWMVASGLAVWLVAVVWHSVTLVAALAQPLKRKWMATPRNLPGVSVIVPVSAHVPAFGPCAESLARLDYPNLEVILCASQGDSEAELAVSMAVLGLPRLTGRIVAPAAVRNPKSALLAAAIPLAAHDLILLSDDNVVSTPGRIQAHLAYREAGYGLVSACVVGDQPLNFWGTVDGAFMNGHFARLQRAGDAVGLSFSTGKSIMVSKDALVRSGGYGAAGGTVCEDAIVQRDLRAIGQTVTLTHEIQRQPIGWRRPTEVWHRHLRWARCRRRHAPLLFVIEAATSGPVAAAAGGFAGTAVDLPFLGGVGATAIMLLSLEWGFLALAGWPHSRWYPATWLTRELMGLALWIVALRPAAKTVWRGRSLALGA